MNIAINGFGRMGRLFLRALLEKKVDGATLVAINDIATPEILAYLFKYDSVHGKFDGEVSHTDTAIVIDGHEIPILGLKVGPDELPWDKYKVDVVIEATGLFADEKAHGHIKSGAKRVLITTPVKEESISTNMIGVNDSEEELAPHNVISCASCTTNSVSAPLRLIHDMYSLTQIFLTTIHSITASNSIVDGIAKKIERGRSGLNNIIPTSTGAAIAVTKAIPELEGKIDARAVRVPTIDGSFSNLEFNTEKETSYDEIIDMLENASKETHKGIIQVEREYPLVSTDIIHNSHSAIVDYHAGGQLNGYTFRLGIWYDNEWGYVNRLVDMVETVGQL